MAKHSSERGLIDSRSEDPLCQPLDIPGFQALYRFGASVADTSSDPFPPYILTPAITAPSSKTKTILDPGSAVIVEFRLTIS